MSDATQQERIAVSSNPYLSPAAPATIKPTITVCQTCGVEAPTRYVEFYQNIGALVVRYHRSVKGHLCKSCIHRYFWKYTSTNLTLGWWGTISLVVTPIYTLNNIGRYLWCARMPAVPEGASRPELTSEAFERLKPYTETLIARLNSRENLYVVASDIAASSEVTQGQVLRYVQALRDASHSAGR